MPEVLDQPEHGLVVVDVGYRDAGRGRHRVTQRCADTRGFESRFMGVSMVRAPLTGRRAVVGGLSGSDRSKATVWLTRIL